MYHSTTTSLQQHQQQQQQTVNLQPQQSPLNSTSQIIQPEVVSNGFINQQQHQHIQQQHQLLRQQQLQQQQSNPQVRLIQKNNINIAIDKGKIYLKFFNLLSKS